jgi:hypothetical protein
MPAISQEVFRVRSHAKTMDEAYALAKKIIYPFLPKKTTASSRHPMDERSTSIVTA